MGSEMCIRDRNDQDDSCASFTGTGSDLCALLMTLPATHPLATMDCDGGGVDNATDCANGGDPLDDQDDSCASFTGTGADLCALLGTLPSTHPLATMDCDGGGVDNATDCANGGDPLNDQDDSCDSFDGTGAELCALILTLPSTHPLATMDCDGGGVDNATDCANGGDPLDDQDDSCASFTGTGADLCALLGTLPATHPLATMDCDGGGVDNATDLSLIHISEPTRPY